LNITFRPIENWPNRRPLRSPDERERSRFDSSWSQTLNLLTFEQALALTGVGRFYDWQVQREILERNMSAIGREMIPMGEAALKAARRFREAMVGE
jgi:hypothetical protein